MPTLQEMIVEVHDQLGQVTDLDIYNEAGDIDPETEGYRRFTDWLNRGLRRVCSWKFPSGEIMRFPSLFRSTTFKAGPIILPIESITGNEVEIVDDDDFSIETASTKLWVLEIEDKRYVVVGQEGNVLTLGEEVPSSVTAQTAKAYKREWKFVEADVDEARFEIPLSAVYEIEAVQRVTQIDNGRQLHRGLSTDYYPLMIGKIGDPTAYYSLTSSLIFDIAPKDDRWYNLEYYSMPTRMESSEQTPEIPEPFHEAVILYATWIGLRRYQEWNGAYATKRDIMDFMRTIRHSYSMNNELEEGYLYINDGGSFV